MTKLLIRHERSTMHRSNYLSRQLHIPPSFLREGFAPIRSILRVIEKPKTAANCTLVRGGANVLSRWQVSGLRFEDEAEIKSVARLNGRRIHGCIDSTFLRHSRCLIDCETVRISPLVSKRTTRIRNEGGWRGRGRDLRLHQLSRSLIRADLAKMPAFAS